MRRLSGRMLEKDWGCDNDECNWFWRLACKELDIVEATLE